MVAKSGQARRNQIAKSKMARNNKQFKKLVIKK